MVGVGIEEVAITHAFFSAVKVYPVGLVIVSFLIVLEFVFEPLAPGFVFVMVPVYVVDLRVLRVLRGRALAVVAVVAVVAFVAFISVAFGVTIPIVALVPVRT